MAHPPCSNNNDNQCADHPLSDGPESAWSTFFKDNEFLLQIDKDVRRLCPDISFFQQVGKMNENSERMHVPIIVITSSYYRQRNFQTLTLLTVEVYDVYTLELPHQYLVQPM